MDSIALRAELKSIQTELRKPLPPSAHKIRELPGKGYWVFVPHQMIRQRLDEVVPEWQSSFSQIEILGENVVCRCRITILGITKEAIGSVPFVMTNRDGKDVSRGSPADRVSAEALKNAAEMWGVGFYLDDQAFVARYLNDHLNELDEEIRNKTLRALIAYLRSNKLLPPVNSFITPDKVPTTEKPTIKPKPTTEAPSQQRLIQNAEPSRDLLMKETESLCTRKNITPAMGQEILMGLYGVKGRSQLTDAQLLGFRDYLANAKSQVPQTV